MEKLTVKRFVSERRKMKARISEFEANQKRSFFKILSRFVAEQSPVENNKVYDVLKGYKPRGCKRFVVFKIEVQFFAEHPIIVAGGWYVSEHNVRTKWGSIIVWGAGNIPKLQLSKCQRHREL